MFCLYDVHLIKVWVLLIQSNISGFRKLLVQPKYVYTESPILSDIFVFTVQISQQRHKRGIPDRQQLLLICTVLFAPLLYSKILCITVLNCTLNYCAVLYCTVLHCSVLYCYALYCTVLTILYCTVPIARWEVPIAATPLAKGP